MEVVADASVVVKWFVDEIYSENARKLREEYINGSIELASPELMPYEVLNALRYTKLFSKDELKLIARSLSLYGFKLYSLRGKLSERTAEIAVEKEITVYDASYIALAESLNSKLYTSDEKLIDRVNLDFVVHVAEI
ncbi:PIN domain nuclease [Archaeoglobales archaeon]|nr:MAG: PIN domain nuclease [Archaeoglobales archaeon]